MWAKKIHSRGLFHPAGEKQSQKDCVEAETSFILLINEHWSNWCNEFSMLGKLFARHNFDKSCRRHRTPGWGACGAGTHNRFSPGAPHFWPELFELQKLLCKHSLTGYKSRWQFSNFVGNTSYILLILFNLNSTARDMGGQVQISSRPVGTDRIERATPASKIKIAENNWVLQGNDRR